MYIKLSSIVASILLVSCNGALHETKTDAAAPFAESLDIDGKYATDKGNLEIITTEGDVYFKLLAVDSTGRTGDARGILSVEGNKAIYTAEDCELVFQFTLDKVDLTQTGRCGMGLNVDASGTYRSTAAANAASVVGKVGDALGALFYAQNEATYRNYCVAGMEENSGNIICKARKKTGQDSDTIVHIFSGTYAGPDGELPPLSVAAKYKIIATY